MPSIHRRAALGLLTAGAVAGCTDRLSLASDDDEDTSPADRRVSPPEPDAGEWLRRTRSFANDLVAPTATPPRSDPEERWRATEREPSSSVLVADDVVLAGGHGGIEARRLEDGERLWSTDEGRPVGVIEGRCYAFEPDAIVALDAETGDESWRYESDDHLRVQDLVEIDGTVYCTVDDELRGLHADTGDRRWTIEGDGHASFLAVADGELHWATPERHRVLTPNGPEPPSERVVVDLDTAVRSHTTPPAVVDGTIGLGGWSDGGRSDPAPIRVLSTRGTIWQRPFEPYVLTPAVLEDRLLVVGYDNSSSGLDEATVMALERNTGDPIWEETLPQPVGSPAVADGVCYVGGGQTGYSETEPGGLFALGVETGDLHWERDTSGSISGHALALVDDAIVLGTDEGVVVLE